jgi:phage tail-like protein
MPTRAEPRNWYDKYAFTVKIDGIVRAAFQKCSELAANIDEIEYSEGGALIPEYSAGRVNFEPLTLERGESADEDMYLWFTQHFDPASGKGNAKTQDYQRNLTIDQRDRAGNVVRSWLVRRAQQKTYSAGDWDNDANEKKIEKVVLLHHGFEMVSAAVALSSPV